MPIVTELLFAAAEFRDPLLPLWAMELLAKIFIYVWLFCVGATVGSFLNVVVYRLPRGKNLAYPGSFCPRCGHPIRGYDNIPIVSWLALRGSCRDCGRSISARYFVVELLVATTFLLVLAAEHFFPPIALGFTTRRLLSPHDGVAFWSMYFLHVALVTTLNAAVLIRVDGFRVPARMYLPVLAAGMVLPIIWPEIRSVPAFSMQSWTGWRVGLIDGLAGLAAGFLVASIGSVWRWQATGHWPMFAPIALASSIGAVLGWQRTLVVFPVALIAGLGAVRALWRFATSAPHGLSSDASRELPAAMDDQRMIDDQLGSPLPAMTPDEISPVPPHEDLDPP
jgi:leader peptidase (prepilin peptidase)/N-methyltransferase